MTQINDYSSHLEKDDEQYQTAGMGSGASGGGYPSVYLRK